MEDLRELNPINNQKINKKLNEDIILKAQHYDNLKKENEILIKEQEKYNKLLKENKKLKTDLQLLVNRIDLLTHDKNYRFLNKNNTWYSRETGKNSCFKTIFKEIDEELNCIKERNRD